MKKLLSTFAVLSLTATSVGSVVTCNSDVEDNTNFLLPSWPTTSESAKEGLLKYSQKFAETLKKQYEKFGNLKIEKVEVYEFLFLERYFEEQNIIGIFLGEWLEFNPNATEFEVYDFNPKTNTIELNSIKVESKIGITRDENIINIESIIKILKESSDFLKDIQDLVNESLKNLESIYNFILNSLNVKSLSSLLKVSEHGKIKGPLERPTIEQLLNVIIDKNPDLENFRDKLVLENNFGNKVSVVLKDDAYIGKIDCRFKYIQETTNATN
ncbi:hypothetical protein [Spiroplasma taiwanense]|uniref:Lipoprotein n=1 Tax=Spiroplasma taiwanense CT-1 TaxID=1276220 RepID=S5MC74_9MOLU|nr:hypothetical protein [Spiroplasma taiwanense]AGR41323.1 hypothetical protein STAIW_v1c07090 [Spiroplasma taiwanense CT-1]